MTTSRRRSEDEVWEFDAPQSLPQNLQRVLVDAIELHLEGPESNMFSVTNTATCMAEIVWKMSNPSLAMSAMSG